MKTLPAKTILGRTKNSGWFGGDFNMNLYRGCCHGCIYCDSRSDCYHVENFDEVTAKADALSILQKELARKAQTGVVATGAMSDPYNPFEKQAQLTRHALELLSAYDFGVAIATKGNLICRDIDILREIQKNSPVICKITLTTLDDTLAGQIEPHAPLPSQRLEAIQQLAAAGLFTGVLLMPVLPWLTDDAAGLLALVDATAKAGARFIYPGFGVTLRTGQREYFYQKLDTLYPGQKLAQKYRNKYGNLYHCAPPDVKSLWQTFTTRCKQLGLLYEMREIIAAYRQGYGSRQLSFFGG